MEITLSLNPFTVGSELDYTWDSNASFGASNKHVDEFRIIIHKIFPRLSASQDSKFQLYSIFPIWNV